MSKLHTSLDFLNRVTAFETAMNGEFSLDLIVWTFLTDSFR